MAAKPDWHIEDIKSAIRKTSETMDRLAVDSGYERTAVRRALRRPWPKVESIIARHLGLKPWEIWPSRYDENGVPLIQGPVRRRRQSSTSATSTAQRKSGAAA